MTGTDLAALVIGKRIVGVRSVDGEPKVFDGFQFDDDFLAVWGDLELEDGTIIEMADEHFVVRPRPPFVGPPKASQG